MDYISHVLPMLGEERVEQRAIDELAEGVNATRRDTPEVARRKGDVAMAGALAEAARELAGRRRTSSSASAWTARSCTSSPSDVAELIAEAQESARSYADGRERFRMLLARRLYEQYGRKLDDLAFRSFDELEALRCARSSAGSSTRAWPRREAGAARAPRARASEGLGRRAAGATPTCRCSTRRARCSTGRRSRTGT